MGQEGKEAGREAVVSDSEFPGLVQAGLRSDTIHAADASPLADLGHMYVSLDYVYDAVESYPVGG